MEAFSRDDGFFFFARENVEQKMNLLSCSENLTWKRVKRSKTQRKENIFFFLCVSAAILCKLQFKVCRKLFFLSELIPGLCVSVCVFQSSWNPDTQLNEFFNIPWQSDLDDYVDSAKFSQVFVLICGGGDVGFFFTPVIKWLIWFIFEPLFTGNLSLNYIEV